jgi:hypothetical protein
VSAATILVLASLLAGVVLVLVAWLGSAHPRSMLGHGGGPVNWNFSTSWASNLTIFGAILTTVAASKILPASTVVASADGYVSLGLLFATLVTVAPFVYNALRTGTPRTDSAGPDYKGRGWALLVACWLTIWATTGQIGTAGLVVYEMQHAHRIALGAMIPLFVILAVSLLLVAVYAVQTIRLVIASTSDDAAFAAPGSTGTTIARRGWSLL